MRPIVLLALSACLVNPGLRDRRIDALTCDDKTEGTSWFRDDDDDGFGVTEDEKIACEQPPGFAAFPGDCDDADRAIHPDAPEICDDVDNNCDDVVDADAIDIVTWYPDADGDLFGDDTRAVRTCDGRPEPEWTRTGGDCDDADPAKNPGLPELCDGYDNDCDGEIDEGEALDAQVYWADLDGDTYGDPNAAEPFCVQPTTHVTNDLDCDDTNPLIHPQGSDVTLQDRDCDGVNADLTVADAELFGTAGDRVGRALAWVGDVNADGLDDFAVGMPGNDPVYGLGETVVVLGGRRLSNMALGAAGPAWSGEDPGDDAGTMVAGGADIDGDGIDDLLMGSPGQGANRGSAYFVPGTTGFGDGSLLDVTEIRGIAGDRFGTAGSVGDLDGDGLADMAIGAPAAGGGDGAVHLIGGAPTFARDVLASDTGARLEGVVSSGAGAAVAVVGDLDGDGLADLVLGAPQDDTVATSAGAAHVVLGARTLPSGPLAVVGVQLLGTDPRGSAGASVAGVQDFDGDGYRDVLVGAPGVGFEDGAAYLLLGSAAGIGGGSLAGADTMFVGVGNQRLGASVASAGDVDGDGAPDLLIGAPEGTGAFGEAWLMLGGQALPSVVDASGAHVVIRGELSGDNAGFLVSGVGDVDGDGYGDLVISGADHRHNSTADTGAVYLLYGMPL